MQIKQALQWGHETLLLTSNSARLDAELLLSHILNQPTTFLLAHDEQKLGFFKLWEYKRMIAKRKKGMPVAYLIGHKEFFFLDFAVNQHVLVPRPDTEILVECVIEYLQHLRTQISELRLNVKYKNIRCESEIRDLKSEIILLDVGTGSACIPIAILKNVEGMTAIATDISDKALKVAKKNIKKHKLQSKISPVKSDLLQDVPANLFTDKEVILTANLPYIPQDFQVNPELKYEPQISLYGGEDGLDIYKRLVDQIKNIRPLAIFFELFEDQIAILKTKLPDYKLKYIKNMSGKARVLIMERS